MESAESPRWLAPSWRRKQPGVKCPGCLTWAQPVQAKNLRNWLPRNAFRRLQLLLGGIPPAEAEANYLRQQASQHAIPA